MPQYICFLRGINVGGKRIIKMDALKQTFMALGAIKVQSYIQSGNIIFEHEQTNTSLLNQQISEAILATYGFEVPVITMTTTHFKAIMEENPFVNQQEQLYVNFIAEKPAEALLEKLQTVDYHPDQLVCTAKALYLYCVTPYHKTKLSQGFLERKLQVTITTRHWKTLEALAALLL